jgi:hypothetical protein
MSTTLLVISDGALSNALATIYTVPAGTKVVIRQANFCNSTAGVVALTVKINARTAGTDRTITSARNLAAGETFLCPELINQVLEPGGLLRAFGLNIEAVVSAALVVEHA